LACDDHRSGSRPGRVRSDGHPDSSVASTRGWSSGHPRYVRSCGPLADGMRADLNLKICTLWGKYRCRPRHIVAARRRLLGELETMFADDEGAVAADGVAIQVDSEGNRAVSLSLRSGHDDGPGRFTGRRPLALPRHRDRHAGDATVRAKGPTGAVKARLTTLRDRGRCRDVRRGGGSACARDSTCRDHPRKSWAQGRHD
jgi:hypothetical protein